MKTSERSKRGYLEGEVCLFNYYNEKWVFVVSSGVLYIDGWSHVLEGNTKIVLLSKEAGKKDSADDTGYKTLIGPPGSDPFILAAPEEVCRTYVHGYHIKASCKKRKYRLRCQRCCVLTQSETRENRVLSFESLQIDLVFRRNGDSSSEME